MTTFICFLVKFKWILVYLKGNKYFVTIIRRALNHNIIIAACRRFKRDTIIIWKYTIYVYMYIFVWFIRGLLLSTWEKKIMVYVLFKTFQSLKMFWKYKYCRKKEPLNLYYWAMYYLIYYYHHHYYFFYIIILNRYI